MFEGSTGAHALRRLETDLIGWMTTVDARGQPQTSPVWFLWDGAEFTVYSLDSARRRNIEGNPRVSLNLDGDGMGGDVVIVEGRAAVDTDLPPAHANQPYLGKYRDRLDAYRWTAEWFSSRYSVPIRITPTRVRHW